MKQDECYKFKDLRVKNFNGKYLITTSFTVIMSQEKNDITIRQLEVSIPNLITVPFPPETLISLEDIIICKKCSGSCLEDEQLAICQSCGSKSLLKSTQIKYQAKAIFVADEVPYTVTMHNQVFFCFINTLDDIPQCKKDKEMALLSNDTMELTFDAKNLIALSVQKKQKEH